MHVDVHGRRSYNEPFLSVPSCPDSGGDGDSSSSSLSFSVRLYQDDKDESKALWKGTKRKEIDQ